jgi:hypothetical protein
MTSKMIKGDWMTDGYLGGRGMLHVDVDATGGLRDMDPACHSDDGLLYLRQYGSDCPVITNGCWTFAPDAAELTRLGLVPVQMIDGAAA